MRDGHAFADRRGADALAVTEHTEHLLPIELAVTIGETAGHFLDGGTFIATLERRNNGLDVYKVSDFQEVNLLGTKLLIGSGKPRDALVPSIALPVPLRVSVS